MSIPLLQTKLIIPPLQRNLVPRPRLLQHVHTGLHVGHRLTLIAAPAGFGKTTLASTWIHQLLEMDSIAGVWLSLDEEDNDPVRFFEYLITAFQKVDASLGQATHSLLGTAQLPPISSLMTLLINDITGLSTPLLLALDDYHVIESALLHEAITFLLEHAPPNFHLMITARGEPPLSLARLRARNLVTDVPPTMLRFTLPETNAFVEHVLGLTLTTQTLAVLDAKTEGWAAGLQLATLSLRDKPDPGAFIEAFGGDNRHVVDYLIGDVLSHLSDALRNFLLKTSVLDRLTAPLCDALTGRADGAQCLRDLEQANLFVFALDENRTWYRYHALFAEFLRTTYAPPHLTSEERAAQHHIAADWFADAGAWPDAVRHALAYAEMTGDTALPARVIVAAVPAMVQHGAFVTVLRWLDALPDQVIKADSELLLYKGWLLLLLGRFATAAAYIKVLQRHPPEDTQLRGRFIGLRAFRLLYEGEHVKALKVAQEALALIADDDLFFRSAVMSILGDAQEAVGDRDGAAQTYRAVQRISEQLGHIFVASYAVVNQAIVLDAQGKLNAAIDLCQQATARYVDTRGRPLPTTGVIYLQLALHLYTANALDEAQQAINVGLALCRQLELTGYVLNGLQVQALLHAANDDVDAGLAVLREARTFPDHTELHDDMREIEALQALLYLEQGNIANTERWAAAVNLPLTSLSDDYGELAYLAYLTLLLVQERLDEVDTLLTTLEQFTRKTMYCSTTIQILLMRVIACRARGNTAGALKYLDQAVTMAAPGGYIRPFVALGEWIADLLVTMINRAPTFVRAVLAALPDTLEASVGNSHTPARSALVEPLSERERDVLRLVAAGLSNREVGAQLFISTGTVRKHLEHIYGKLGVHNRTEAVTHARLLDLL